MSRPRQGLRIAMIAPPYYEVPPRGYGGVEAVVADLVDGLVSRGHHITLIGAGRHGTRAQQFRSSSPIPPSERLGEPLPEVVHTAYAASVLEAVAVDLVHDHTLAGPLLARGRAVPTVVTVHGPVDDDPGRYYRLLGGSVHLIGISDRQRSRASDLPWLGTVHNAIPVASYPFRDRKERFALFLGRFHRDKAPHLAIDAARAAGLPIVLVGKCSEPVELEYFEQYLTPRLGPDVEVSGMAGSARKRDLLSRAQCLLFPSSWEEPFGLVMVEAMACGTPVIALRRGSVPEIVRDGITGLVVDRPDQLAAAVERAGELSPTQCRQHVLAHFDLPRMITGYERAYFQVLDRTHEPDIPRAG